MVGNVTGFSSTVSLSGTPNGCWYGGGKEGVKCWALFLSNFKLFVMQVYDSNRMNNIKELTRYPVSWQITAKKVTPQVHIWSESPPPQSLFPAWATSSIKLYITKIPVASCIRAHKTNTMIVLQSYEGCPWSPNWHVNINRFVMIAAKVKYRLILYVNRNNKIHSKPRIVKLISIFNWLYGPYNMVHIVLYMQHMI